MSRRSYQKRATGGKQREARRVSPDVQLPLCREELVAMMQDSLASFATEMGLRVAAKLLEDEVDRRCGVRYEHRTDRQLTRYGRQRGVVMLAGQKLPVQKPRVRRTDGQGEVELETYTLRNGLKPCPRPACGGWYGAFRRAITSEWSIWPPKASA